MANTIRVKRRANGGGGGAPSSLANAELAFNEQTNILYYGTGTGGAGGTATSIIPIAGSGAFAPLDSAALTGTPTAPTATADTNTTQLATTAYVIGQSSNATPQALGTAAAGTSLKHSRADHVHAMPKISDLNAPTASVAFGSQKITGLADPTAAQDGATKAYVDAVAQGLRFKDPARVATTANITLSGTQTIDGVSVIAGDRVLVKNQSTTSQNGFYVVAAGAWSRSSDADTWAELVSAFCFVSEGSTQGDTSYVCTVDAGGTLGTTPVTFVQFGSATSYSAGNGLGLSGNVFSVLANGTSLDISSSGVKVSATYAGQTSITTLGTVATGTWNGTTVDVAHGGTGATTLTGYVKGAGTSALSASSTIPNTDISGLGTMSTQNAGAVAITGGTIDGITLDGGTF
jgi:hypothetical protein